MTLKELPKHLAVVLALSPELRNIRLLSGPMWFRIMGGAHLRHGLRDLNWTPKT